MPYQLMHLVFQKVRNAPVPFFIKPVARGLADHVLKTFVQPNIDDQLRFMEAELATRPWFAGDAFTAADIQMSFPVEAAAKGAGLGSTHPHLADFLPASTAARPGSGHANVAAPTVSPTDRRVQRVPHPLRYAA